MRKSTANAEKVYIYKLVDPRDHLVYYIGQTTNLPRRYAMHLHINPIDVDFSDRHKWILDLQANDLKPEMIVITIVKPMQADDTEQYWIKKMFKAGYPLTNQESVRLKHK